MTNDLLYQVALGTVPQIGHVHAKILATHYGSAEAVFKARKRELEKLEGIGSVRAANIKQFNDFSSSEKEIRFIEQHHITPLFFLQPDYPKRLLGCYDGPALLYYKGTVSLNQDKIVAVVGTRNNSTYGKWLCEQLIADLASEEVMVLSGLAYGIDTIAHRSALQQGLPTVGVLAHGLDQLYPAANHSLARQMLKQGGLLTEFCSGHQPDKQHFPRRNRIVAGCCDCLVVVETTAKGGSMITAELANGYHKDVFAFPGRCNEISSTGCHELIKQYKAQLITSATDIVEAMNWKQQPASSLPIQPSLFPDLGKEEQSVWNIIKETQSIHIDALCAQLPFTMGTMANLLLQLEMKGVIVSMPGKMYRLL